MKAILLLALVSFPAFALLQSTDIQAGPPAKAPRNIILLIGDGMGLTQVTAGLYSHDNHLQLERFPVTGIMKTHSARHLITDSAAGATAFSCGCKTYNGAIGVCADKKSYPTILEQAHRNGLATGLVATSSITHATPAAFIAHVASRADMEDIAAFFLQTDIDLFIGGGLKYFQERSTDQRDLYQELSEKGYVLSTFAEHKLNDLKPDPSHRFGWFSAREEPVGVAQGRDYLPTAAALAPAFLKKRSTKGFFMMLEGSQIDWACHSNHAEDAEREMLDFDQAIGEILKFAEADGETLVIVTADHETGGMSIKERSEMDSLNIGFNTDYHTASLVPVFAYGPGSEQFHGVLDNTDIYAKMYALFQFPRNGN